MCITLSVPLFKGSNLIAKVIIYLNNYICASFSVLFSGSVCSGIVVLFHRNKHLEIIDINEIIENLEMKLSHLKVL